MGEELSLSCYRLNQLFLPLGILDKVTRLRVLFTRPLAILIGTRALLYIDDPAGMECVLNAPECLDKTFMQEGFFARRGLLHARGKWQQPHPHHLPLNLPLFSLSFPLPGQKWKLRRKQLNPAFNHNIVVSFFDVFNTVGNQLVEQFATQSHLHGDAVKFKDAEDMLSRAVLEVSCREYGQRGGLYGKTIASCSSFKYCIVSHLQ